jgi:hypothetical protein
MIQREKGAHSVMCPYSNDVQTDLRSDVVAVFYHGLLGQIGHLDRVTARDYKIIKP